MTYRNKNKMSLLITPSFSGSDVRIFDSNLGFGQEELGSQTREEDKVQSNKNHLDP